MSIFSYFWSSWGQPLVLVLLTIYIIRAWHRNETGRMVIVIVIGVIIWLFGSNPVGTMTTLANIMQSIVDKIPH